MRPTELGEIFTTEWTREAIEEVVNKGIGHLTQVCVCDIKSPFSHLFYYLRVTFFGTSSVTGKWRC